MSVPPLSHVIPVTHVPGSGRVIKIVATDDECAAVASECGLIGLERLEAEFTVTKGSGRLLAVQGHISADVTQSCGVTLKPVDEALEADVALTYTLDPKWAELIEVDVNPDDDDPPEPVIDGQIDFGAVVLEHFALNLNPYPRAEGVAFDAEQWTEDDGEGEDADQSNPFAVLAELKSSVNDP